MNSDWSTETDFYIYIFNEEVYVYLVHLCISVRCQDWKRASPWESIGFCSTFQRYDIVCHIWPFWAKLILTQCGPVNWILWIIRGRKEKLQALLKQSKFLSKKFRLKFIRTVRWQQTIPWTPANRTNAFETHATTTWPSHHFFPSYVNANWIEVSPNSFPASSN